MPASKKADLSLVGRTCTLDRLTGVLDGAVPCEKPATHEVRWRGIDPRLGVAAYVCEEHLQQFDRFDDEYSIWSLDMTRYSHAMSSGNLSKVERAVPKGDPKEGRIQAQQIIPGRGIDGTTDDLIHDPPNTSASSLDDSHDGLSEVPTNEESEIQRAVEKFLGPNRR